MSLSVVNNVSLVAQSSLNRSSGLASSGLQELSSGLKISSGDEDPAEFVISQEQRAQITQVSTAIDSTSKAVSMVQTSEGALSSVSDLLTQARSLAQSSASDTTGDSNALAANQAQLQNIFQTINSIAQTSQYGSTPVAQGGIVAQTSDGQIDVGSTAPSGATATVNLPDLRVTGSDAGLGELSGLSISSAGSAAQALTSIDSAIASVNSSRDQLGAFQSNLLQAQATNLQTSLQNTTAANSVVTDTDFSSTISNFTQLQTQLQSGPNVLSNANQVSGLLSKLLQK